jgi:hypothetical protein
MRLHENVGVVDEESANRCSHERLGSCPAYTVSEDKISLVLRLGVL